MRRFAAVVLFVCWYAQSEGATGTGAEEVNRSELTLQAALDRISRREGSAGGQRTTLPVWVPGTHHLIYSSGDTETYIYTFDVDGKRRERIRPGAQPVPSPNGKQLVFLDIGKDSGEGAGKPQIWISDARGLHAEQLTSFPSGVVDSPWYPFRLEWSPDSTHLAYLEMRTTGVRQRATDEISTRYRSSAIIYPEQATNQNRLRLADLQVHIVEIATRRDQVVPIKETTSFSWLDSKTLVFEAINDFSQTEIPTAEVRLLSLPELTTRRLLTGYYRQPFYRPVRSPTGKYLAFQADVGQESVYPNRSDLALFSMASATVRVMTRSSRVAVGTWEPSEKGLVIVDGPSTRRDLHFVSLEGGKQHPITRGGLNTTPRFSGDGVLMAWKHVDYTGRSTIRVGRWKGMQLSDVEDVVVLDDPLEGFRVGTTESVQWTSKDGLLVDGYLTFPPDYDGTRSYPLVVVLHGGPTSGSDVTYKEWPCAHYFPHLLAREGYLVFQPDYRASGMLDYEKIIEARKNDDRFEGDLEDVLSGVRYLQGRGLAIPGRTFVIGHSNGSTEVNWFITRTHDFRAAVSYDGVDFLIDWYWAGADLYYPNPTIEWYMRGSALDRAAVYHRNSAVSNARAIRTPTLFITGGQNAINSPGLRWLYAALVSKGVDAAYVHYPDEGHVVRKPENVADLYERILAWIRKHDQVH